MQVGVPSCRWHYRSLTDWIRPVGITTWAGDLGSPGIAFTVDPNTTRAERVGRIAVSETVWEVRQLP